MSENETNVMLYTMVSPPDVHEPNPPNVGRVVVVQHGLQLPTSQFQSEQFVKNAVCSRNYSTCSNSSDLEKCKKKKKKKED